MRSHDDEVAIGVIAFLARLHAQATTFSRYLRETQALLGPKAGVALDVECQHGATGPVLSVWIEGDAGNEDALTWWIDISALEAGWLLEASILWNGRSTLLELPKQTIDDFDSVQQVAPVVIEELFNAGKPIFEDAIDRARGGQP